ncbi:MAG: 4Fe-4S binding protein [Infirmifilum sp.]
MVEVKVLSVGEPPSPEDLSRLADTFDGVIVVGKGYPSSWHTIIQAVRRAGSRWHRIVFINSERDVYANGLSLEDVIEAYKAYFEALSEFIPVVVSDTGKTVSRRDLLKSGLGVFFVYTALPDVKLQECSSLRDCRLCLSSCPFDAISGKPPKVSERSCLECGLCTSACPTGLLFTPVYAPEAVKRLFRALAQIGATRITITCPLARTRFYSERHEGSLPVELQCIASLRVHEFLYARQLGLTIDYYCPDDIRSDCPRRKAAEDYIAMMKELDSIIKPVAQTIVDASTLGALLEPLAREEDTWADLERLPLFRVDVDKDKCTLCGACANSCPTHALTLTRGDQYSLSFNHSSCIGCNTCVRVCPEAALRLARAANPRLLTSKEGFIAAQSPIARCRSCGKELGPERMIKRLEEKLARSGAPRSVLESIWLCPECKAKASEEEFKRLLGALS